MASKNQGKKESAERKRWLETLLDRISAPADVMRQHLSDGQAQHAGNGAAAETGVRDVLRMVLPNTLAVTSGFIRDWGSPMTEISPHEKVSPQTDVIIYNALTATPLHSIGHIGVISALDVLGILEVKDTKQGSIELSIDDKDNGALRQLADQCKHCPAALRAIILFRGREKDSDKIERIGEDGASDDLGDQKKGPGRPPIEEWQAAQERLNCIPNDKIQIPPHVIYCRSYKTSKGEDGSYLAFYDALAHRMRIHEYHNKPTHTLASFLRIVTGFFAARGLISPSLHLDLLPGQPDFDPDKRDLNKENKSGMPDPDINTKPLPPLHSECLYRLLLDHANDATNGDSSFFDRRIREFFEHGELANPVLELNTGRDLDGLPTSGYLLKVERHCMGEESSAGIPTYAAFFYLTAPSSFTCAPKGLENEPRWTIETATLSLDDFTGTSRRAKTTWREESSPSGGNKS